MPLYIKQNNQMVKVSDGIALTDLEDKTVALDMSNGDQVVNATTGKVMSSVTIEKPSTMVASNIKDGVDIGGVVGSYTATNQLTNRISEISNPYDYYDTTTTIIVRGAFTRDINIRNVEFTQHVVLNSDFSNLSNMVTFKANVLSTSASGSFRDSPELTTINVNSFGTVNYANLCNNCPKLTTFPFEKITTALGNGAFTQCIALTSANLENALGSNAYGVFGSCTSLTTVSFGALFTQMGATYFAYDTALTDVTLKANSVVSLGNTNSFLGVGHVVNIHVPSSLISSYQSASNWSTLYNNGDVTFVAIQ